MTQEVFEKQQGQFGTITLSKYDPELWNELKVLAFRNNSNPSSIVHNLVDKFLKECGQ